MPSETCPTVKVKANNEQGFIVINESDFDKDKQTLFTGEEKPKSPGSSSAQSKADAPAK